MVPDALTGGPRFAAFCEHYVRHTKGRWAREPLRLEDWQRDFWWEALEVDPVTGLRVYSEVGLGLPRKNGKSVQASAAGLYFLSPTK
jgi:phage terminase large subunit-like protein